MTCPNPTAPTMRRWSWSLWLTAVVFLLVSLQPAAALSFGDDDDPPTERKPGATAADAGIPTSADSWGMYGKDYNHTFFSPLNQITTDNVANLKVSYTVPLGVLEAFQGTPLMVDGTLFVTTPKGPEKVFAIDARTGRVNWERTFNIPGDVARFACCGIVNRGAAYGHNTLFVGRLDGMLMALDPDTGETKWEVQAVSYEQGSVITSPPLIVGDKVITGFGGGEYGAHGMLHAFDVASGETVWTADLLPEEVHHTWKDDSWRTGGSAAWFTGSYDPDMNLIYYGTSNPSPWSAAVRGPDTSDFGEVSNLYSASSLALNPDTGEIVWHYQSTPYDAWDYDGSNEHVLADLEIDGESTPVAMKADRNGFFYVMHRETGELISAEPFMPVNWASHVDMETGRPVENPEKRPRTGHVAQDVMPSFLGGKNWQPMSFNQNTGLAYIPSNDMSMNMQAESEVEYNRGFFFLGAEWDMETGPTGSPGHLTAWDPVAQEEVWRVPQTYPINGGVMSTAGNVVFHGNIEGDFKAYHAETGEELWSFTAGSGINSTPMTYELDGKQYVALTVGRPTVIPGFVGGDLGRAMVEATPAGGMLVVFELGE